MSDLFYRAFENRHRGPRELVKSRQRVYLPFIAPLIELSENPKAIDLGCGRGEWLELLKEAGIDGHGVDLDDGMLAACRDAGLSVATQDALSALKLLPDESQTVVSGFHIAEHISFSELQSLHCEALRVLVPGGLLILETPNPENIMTATVNFYVDPTHQRPIPSQLLSFLSEYHGFQRVKVIRLQEDKALANTESVTLADVLGGVSPDYAVVAQKSADSLLLKCTSAAFDREYGLTLGALVGKFDQQAREIKSRAAQAESRAAQAESQLFALRQSTSWRITAPLRAVKDAITARPGSASEPLRQWGCGLKSLTNRAYFFTRRIGVKLIRRQLTWIKRLVARSPAILNIARKIANSSPRLKTFLVKALGSSGRHTHASTLQGVALTHELAALTPRARSLYRRLRQNVGTDEAGP
jgi:O-antigen chain-terminating methyltransferase